MSAAFVAGRERRAPPAVTWARRSLWLLIPLLALPLLWPLFNDGLPRASDTALHMVRLELLDRHLRAGSEWPRWLPEMSLGYGYPFFSFYAPATYYLAELFHLAGLNLAQSWMAVSALLVVGSGLAMTLLAGAIFGQGGRTAALAAGVAYMASPYLLTNVYVRGAFGEAGAQMLLPLVLWSLRALLVGPEPARAAPWLILTLSLLLLTHTISLLLVPPLLVAYGLLLWRQSGWSRARLGWALGTVAVALALSAAFWLPLLADRGLITQAGYEIARTVRLPAGMWNWSNFLDAGLPYTYTFTRPVKLGLAQGLPALVGFFAAWRVLPRRDEWLFWLVVAGCAGALMGAWALPLWQNTILSTAQNAWRLLTFVSLPAALLAGGVVLRVRNGLLRWGAAALLAAFLLWAHAPRLEWMDYFASAQGPLRNGVVAQIEVDKGVAQGGEENSNIQEFRPRWAPTTLTPDAQPRMAGARSLRVDAANAFDMSLVVQAELPGDLRFATFYYPGWAVYVNGKAAETFPSTRLGLLTVTLPAGESRINVRWAGTAAQRLAPWLSLGALAFFALYGLLRREARGFVFPGGAALALGVAALISRPALAEVTPLDRSFAGTGLTAAGLHVETIAGASEAQIFWQVTEPPPADLRVRLRLLDNQGTPLAESTSAVFYNSGGAQAWPVGTVVDDRYELPRVSNPAGGPLTLQLAVAPAGFIAEAPLLDVTTIAALAPPQDIPTAHESGATVGDFARLSGYSLQGVDEARPGLWVARPGDRVRLTLRWQALATPPRNFVAFAHLLDGTGNGLVKEDQQPGPLLEPTGAWVSGHAAADEYLLRIPPDTVGGLYAPWVGMVDPATGARLPVFEAEGAVAAEELRLPPFKVLGAPPPPPTVALDARLGEVAELIGYDVAQERETLRPGDMLTVTLHLRALAPTPVDYTRFLHLYSPETALAAQADAPPRDGRNPTSVWLPGEVILDTVVLTIADDAQPGNYQLLSGLYTAGDGARLPVLQTGAAADPAANAVLLREIPIQPAGATALSDDTVVIQ